MAPSLPGESGARSSKERLHFRLLRLPIRRQHLLSWGKHLKVGFSFLALPSTLRCGSLWVSLQTRMGRRAKKPVQGGPTMKQLIPQLARKRGPGGSVESRAPVCRRPTTHLAVAGAFNQRKIVFVPALCRATSPAGHAELSNLLHYSRTGEMRTREEMGKVPGEHNLSGPGSPGRLGPSG